MCSYADSARACSERASSATVGGRDRSKVRVTDRDRVRVRARVQAKVKVKVRDGVRVGFTLRSVF